LRDDLVRLLRAIQAAGRAANTHRHAAMDRFNIEFVFGATATLNLDFHRKRRGSGRR
jgi:hypothetical protein